MTTAEIITEAQPWEAIADGEYAIVELFGHATLVGRIAEVERFGTKMLAIEPLFNGALLGPIYHGGAAIYRLTPCTRQNAWEHQPRDLWQLPSTVRAVVPTAALPQPAESQAETFDVGEFEEPDADDGAPHSPGLRLVDGA